MLLTPMQVQSTAGYAQAACISQQQMSLCGRTLCRPRQYSGLSRWHAAGAKNRALPCRAHPIIPARQCACCNNCNSWKPAAASLGFSFLMTTTFSTFSLGHTQMKPCSKGGTSLRRKGVWTLPFRCLGTWRLQQGQGSDSTAAFFCPPFPNAPPSGIGI